MAQDRVSYGYAPRNCVAAPSPPDVADKEVRIGLAVS